MIRMDLSLVAERLSVAAISHLGERAADIKSTIEAMVKGLDIEASVSALVTRDFKNRLEEIVANSLRKTLEAVVQEMVELSVPKIAAGTEAYLAKYSGPAAIKVAVDEAIGHRIKDQVIYRIYNNPRLLALIEERVTAEISTKLKVPKKKRRL